MFILGDVFFKVELPFNYTLNHKKTWHFIFDYNFD